MATKLVPFLTLLLLLLFELGSGVHQPALPKEEEAFLLDFFGESGNYCNDRNLWSAGVDVNCDCTYKNNTVCHVTALSMRYTRKFDLQGNWEDLSALKYIDFSWNKLTGSIPDNLGKLPSLKQLDLNHNYLTGSIPSSLGNLSSLEGLHLGFNSLSGPIPRALGNLSNLRTMYLSQNNLSGNLPPELGSLSRLQYLSVGSNRLIGELPKEYANLTSLVMFTIGGNSFTGRIPNFFAKWTSLSYLNLAGNDFEGDLPLEIFNLSNLWLLRISDLRNSSVSFPNRANITQMEYLTLRNCSIAGQIPPYIFYLPSLKQLDLSFNNLIGGLPDTIKSKNLNMLFLARNMLSGPIPSWISSFDRADLSYNNFTNSSSNITKTKLDGFKINVRTILDLKDKHCQGKEYNNLFINCGGEKIRVEGIDYDGDNARSNFNVDHDGKWAYACSGGFLDYLSNYVNRSDYIRETTNGSSIFENDGMLYKTARLCPVSLSYHGFCMRKGNYTVKLHFIENTFAMDDDDYSKLKERIFDVYIQGERRLKDFNIKYEANGPNRIVTKVQPVEIQDNFLEIHLFWAGKGSQIDLNGPLISAIAVTPNFKHGEKLSPPQIAGIAVGAVLTPLLVLTFMWQMGWLESKELQKIHIEVQGKSVTLQQIIDATRNFSSKKEIGKGRYGIVYKAELPDEIKLAVKKISPDINQQEKNELKSEIFSLKSLRHENVVQLLDGYCDKKGLYLLIYEYMDNGSLHQALFDPNSRTILDWKVRYDICLGIAKGLKYLHEEKRFDIVHGNIKAANILLDKSYTAKLSDFGLARLCREEDPFMSIIKARAARVYMAPEYARGEVITVKADVYSFGVVVLEIVSGKISADHTRNGEIDFLLDRAWVLHTKKRILDLVDKKLSNYDRKQAITVLNLAITCINHSATLRPTMSEVVGVLSEEITLDQISKANTS
ncbi:probable LRR receptor-like serine/threonine-protein kinase At1g53440 [Hevea brasiliensis]|uniref:probable LRR receptor-like serine/threonine-protein kinase At1g53440 n=1 Tax=Hevea brasiliensis TaxID=3981 RepID=UPI0025FBC819|nr:probable LRR receptor-like serine/threonine-protein kinase At1g53440 [Hevea brasiliensis]